MSNCLFPLCKSHAQSNGYCVSHKMYSSFTEVKAKTCVNKKSDKRKEDEKEYRKIVSKMLVADNKCAIKSPECTKIAQGLHHMKGRIGENYLDTKHLKRSCNACNGFVERHPEWAKKNGHSISRHKKEAL